MERLQKRIANSGYCSRRKAEELIKKGKVKVNGSVVTELGFKVENKDQVMVDDILIEDNTKVYILLNKPRGVVCTTDDDKNRKIITSLIDTDIRIFPVGRLDYDTTGLILLTNDGELANILTHPSSDIEKTYVAKISGKLLPNELMTLKNGVVIDGKKTKRAKLKIKSYDKKTDTSIVIITITEGRNHQVKKMFEKVGHKVLKLKREKYAFLTLDGLSSKEYRTLTIKEVKKLYSLSKKEK
ncbi:MAG: rRNA pseudouridine synthase [Bacilli bacterium]|nr:rRNA pseudouridine synthase [Bacilli bacterium]